jgi:hypothetical protein
MIASTSDLELYIRRTQGAGYVVEVRFWARDGAVESRLISGDPPLITLEHDALRQASLRPDEYGRALTGMFFADSRLLDAFHRAREFAKGAGAPLRVRLRLDLGASELHSIRWETLQDPSAPRPGFLFTDNHILISRYLDTSEIQPVAARARDQLTALIAVASPDDLGQYQLAPIDAHAELERARTALGAIPSTCLAAGTEWPRATFAALVEALHQGADILYLVCHGALLEDVPYLWLEQSDGRTHHVPGDDFVAHIRALAHPPRLVVLASCRSAGAILETANPLFALGPQLAQAGIGAVVAMHDAVTMAAVATGMETFFRQLREHGQVDQAMAAARSVSASHAQDWWRLVLFSRLRDGRLWVDLGDRQGQAEPAPIVQAPWLPPHFVPRPEISETLKTDLLAASSETPGVLVLYALHGAGGMGKTTLAAALAHDPDIQRRFRDGILWMTFGQQPDVAAISAAWLQAFGEPLSTPLSPQGAAARLRQIVREKTILVVLDDVWEPEIARLFLFVNQRSRVLITTRRADVADALNATRRDLEVMPPVQALALLERCLGRSLAAEEHMTALQFAAAVGFLPLALEMAALRIRNARDSIAWSQLHAALTAEIARLEELESPRRRIPGQTRLDACFNLSLEALRAEDERAWHGFAWLGVFRPKAPIVAPMLANLLDVSLQEATRIIELLWNDALLHANGELRVGETHWPAYNIHDLLHAIARNLLTAAAPQGLGLTWSAAHATLLERYRAVAPDGMWHTLDDDGYCQNHLLWHMEQANWHHELHQLLLASTAEQQNGWFVLRERDGRLAEYLADIEYGWRSAETNAAQDELPMTLGRQWRYLLISASLSSLACTIPLPLLLALVRHAVWSPAQALAYARQIPDAGQRATAIVALAHELPEQARVDALTEALRTAQTISDEVERAQTVAILADALPLALVQRALECVHTLRSAEARQAGLSGLLPRLAALGFPEEALTEARTIQDDHTYGATLIKLADHLPAALIAQALHEVRRMGDWRARILPLAYLAQYSPEPLNAEALCTIATIRDEHARAQLLADVAVYLPGPWLAPALDTARALRRSGAQVTALFGLLPRLAALGQAEQAFAEAQAIRDEQMRAAVFTGMASHLAEPLLRQAVNLSHQIRARDLRERTIAKLAPRLAEVGFAQEALATALTLRIPKVRAMALANIAPHLPEYLLAQALSATQDIRYGNARALALAGLAPHLPRQFLSQALQLARAIGDIWAMVRAQAALAPYGSPALLAQALQACLALPHGSARTESLAELAPHLPPPLMQQALATLTPEREWDWVEALAVLVPLLAPDLLAHAYTLARGLVEPQARVQALVYLVPYLPDMALHEALRTVYTMGSQRAQALVRLAAFLPKNRLNEALLAVRNVGNQRQRAELLLQLMPHLPASLLPKAVDIAQAIGDARVRAETLGQMASYLPEPLVRHALDIVNEIQAGSVRISGLKGLLPRLIELGHEQEALTIAHALRRSAEQSIILSTLAPKLAKAGHAHMALETAWKIRQPQLLEAALIQAAPYLPEAAVREALSAIYVLGLIQADVLVSLLARLAILGHPQDALREAWRIKNVTTLSTVLVELLPYVPPSALPDILDRLRRLAPAIAAQRDSSAEQPFDERVAQERYDWHASLLVAILPHFVAQDYPAAKLMPLWNETLHALSNLSRRQTLDAVRHLAPVIVALGGSMAVDEIFRAISEIGQWFP